MYTIILSYFFSLLISPSIEFSSGDGFIEGFEIEYESTTSFKTKYFWKSNEDYSGNKQFEYLKGTNNASNRLSWPSNKQVSSLRVFFYVPDNEELTIRRVKLKIGKKAYDLNPQQIVNVFDFSAVEVLELNDDYLRITPKRVTGNPSMIFSLQRFLKNIVIPKGKEIIEISFVSSANSLVRTYVGDSISPEYNDQYQTAFLKEGVRDTLKIIGNKSNFLHLYFPRQTNVDLLIEELKLNAINGNSSEEVNLNSSIYFSKNLNYSIDSGELYVKSNGFDDHYSQVTIPISPYTLMYPYELKVFGKLKFPTLIRSRFGDGTTIPYIHHEFKLSPGSFYYHTEMSTMTSLNLIMLEFMSTQEENEVQLDSIKVNDLNRGISQKWDYVSENFDIKGYSEEIVHNRYKVIDKEVLRFESSSNYLFDSDRLKYILILSTSILITTMFLYVFNKRIIATFISNG